MKKQSKNKAIAIFEGKQIRRHWDEEKELWYFAVIDVIATLTNSNNPQVYWRVLKKRLIDEGSNETVTKCNALKMTAPDGKMRLLYGNKDGKYVWRKYELINPLLYVSLVNIVTEKSNWKVLQDRFKEFKKDKNIECKSDISKRVFSSFQQKYFLLFIFC